MKRLLPLLAWIALASPLGADALVHSAMVLTWHDAGGASFSGSHPSSSLSIVPLPSNPVAKIRVGDGSGRIHGAELAMTLLSLSGTAREWRVEIRKGGADRVAVDWQSGFPSVVRLAESGEQSLRIRLRGLGTNEVLLEETIVYTPSRRPGEILALRPANLVAMTSRVEVEYEPTENRKAVFQIYDLRGKLIQESEAPHSMVYAFTPASIRGMPHGIYWVDLRENGRLLDRKRLTVVP